MFLFLEKKLYNHNIYYYQSHLYGYKEYVAETPLQGDYLINMLNSIWQILSLSSLSITAEHIVSQNSVHHITS